MGRKGISQDRHGGASSRRRAMPLTWTLLAVVLAAALTVGACALWLPDRAPALLGAAGEATNAPASMQEYAGNQQVTVVPTMSADRELIGNATGTVTADWSSDGLSSGRAAYKVNDRVTVALATSTPLYRDLKTGDRGDDVLALNNELNRLGYNSAPESDTYLWATSDGWRQLMVDNGNTSDGELTLSDVLWIPEAQVAVSSWTATQGSAVASGAPVGVVPGSIVALAIKNGQTSEQDRTITVLGQTTTLPAGAVEITDEAFCAQVAATDEYRMFPKESLSSGFDASLALTEPMQVLRVPAGAVFGLDGQSGCIATGTGGADTLDVVPVTVIGGELGTSLVRPDAEGGSSIGEVAIGSALNDLTCR